ncbi:MAG: prolyl oligopeptidase family serine peptidase, partial [Asticcacaulis sp.]
DNLVWLEEVMGDKALNWVRTENERSLNVLQNDPRYAGLLENAKAIVNSTDRIAYPGFRAGKLDNFWQDKANVRGLWRRTTLESYRTSAPVWETILDFDALAKSENANWVYKGAACLEPEERLCLLNLSDGGKDAVTVREFDAETKTFVAGGFALPEGKQSVAWIDKDTLLVAREWTPGEVTESGYAYVVKTLKRGQSLDQATEVYRGKKTDMGAWPTVIRDADGKLVAQMVVNRPSFFEAEYHVITPKGTVRLDLPRKSSFQAWLAGQAIYSLEEAWNGFPQGALISFDFNQAVAGTIKPTLILAPGERQAIEGVSTTRNTLVVELNTNVTGEVRAYSLKGGSWSHKVLDMPKNLTLGLGSTNNKDDRIFLNAAGFTTPSSLYLADAATGKVEKLKALPDKFDASNMVVHQREATSKDGTKIPYFVVHHKDMKHNGENPTLLYAYGGFQVSMQPSYSANTGKLWLERGGVYVLANIRGGGEFGPKWHQAGLKTKRQVIYDDFQAVAEDLVKHKITSPRRLGIQGGSNGGLLMGVQLTQRPDLWNAVIVQVPLLDMMRYHKLLAGASWMGEYGNPEDPTEGAFLKKISPYHNLKTGVKYPEPFFVTSTKDDRVHPGHARKMAAKMQEMGLPFYYYENIDGGHSAAANLQEAAKRVSLEMTYLTRKLMD